MLWILEHGSRRQDLKTLPYDSDCHIDMETWSTKADNGFESFCSLIIWLGDDGGDRGWQFMKDAAK